MFKETGIMVHVVMSSGEHVDTVEIDVEYDGRGSIFANYGGERHIVEKETLFGEVNHTIIIPSWKAKKLGVA